MSHLLEQVCLQQAAAIYSPGGVPFPPRERMRTRKQTGVHALLLSHTEQLLFLRKCLRHGEAIA